MAKGRRLHIPGPVRGGRPPSRRRLRGTAVRLNNRRRLANRQSRRQLGSRFGDRFAAGRRLVSADSLPRVAEQPLDLAGRNPLAHSLAPDERLFAQRALRGELPQFNRRDRSARLIVFCVIPLDLGHEPAASREGDCAGNRPPPFSIVPLEFNKCKPPAMICRRQGLWLVIVTEIVLTHRWRPPGPSTRACCREAAAVAGRTEGRHGSDVFPHSLRCRAGRPASPTAPPLCDRPGRMPAPPERLLTLPSIGLESGPNNRDRGRPTPK